MKRLRQVETGMNITQMILLEIDRARRHPDMYSHCIDGLKRPLSPKDTLCGRIEDAVLAATKGRPERSRNESIKAAQKQGLFLIYLFHECNARLARTARERELESALLVAHRGLYAARPDQKGAQNLLKAATVIADGLRAEAEAARLLEGAYFKGASILYPGTAADLQARITEADEIADWAIDELDLHAARGHRAAQKGKKTNQDWAANAREIADSIVTSAKAKVLYEFGQNSDAEAVLRLEFLGPEGRERPRPGLSDPVLTGTR